MIPKTSNANSYQDVNMKEKDLFPYNRGGENRVVALFSLLSRRFTVCALLIPQ
jgi:hypothetical protein